MVSFQVFVCLTIFLVGSFASEQFRGGYLTYRIDRETDFTYDMTILFTSAWEGAPNDCVGSGTGQTSGIVSLEDQPVRNNPSNRVTCNTANSNGIRVGSSSWVVNGIFKGTARPIRYGFTTGWKNFACCVSTLALFPAAQSITMDTRTPIGQFSVTNSLNNPPAPTSFQVISIQQGTTGSFPIALSDPENDRIACRVATTQAEGGAISSTQQATAGGANGCTITIDATTKAAGQYPAAFIIEDFAPGSTTPSHSIPYQVVYTVTSSTTGPVGSFPATVTCSPDLIVVSIPSSSFNGALPAADRVTFTDPNCRSTLTNGVYELRTGLTTCGTVYIGQTEDHLVYENSITVGRTSGNLITREFQVTLKVTCRYVRKQQSENDKSFIANGLITAQEENFGNFVLDLRAFDSTFRTPITTFPMSVDLGTRQYCQIDVQNSNPDVVVVVERIFASNNPTRAGLPHYDLINNRCPADNTVTLNNIGATKDQFRFSFDAFAFTLDVTQAIYIHCDTFLCHKTSNDVRCLQTCASDSGLNVNNVRRVGGTGRRSLDEQIGEQLVVDEPSKIYFLVVGPYARQSSQDLAVSDRASKASFWNEGHFIILACAMLLVFIIVVAFFIVKLRLAKQTLEISQQQGFSKAMA